MHATHTTNSAEEKCDDVYFGSIALLTYIMQLSNKQMQQPNATIVIWQSVNTMEDILIFIAMIIIVQKSSPLISWLGKAIYSTVR